MVETASGKIAFMEKTVNNRIKGKIYILGAFGYLGGQCSTYFRSRGYEVLNEKVDITDLPSTIKAFQKYRPDAAINLTGPPANPTIDWCEDNKEETIKMIVSAPINFAVAAAQTGAYPIQITSGCVYNGGVERTFTEDDEPNFFGSFYSRMRVVGQKALAELPVLQARIRMPISCIPHPRNTVTKIISYKKLISLPNSVTFLDDLWPAIERTIDTRPIGILNLTNDGYITHEQIINAYRKVINPNHNYEKISLEQLEEEITKSKRSNCILGMKKAKSLGIYMPGLTNERLNEIMEKYKTNLAST